MKNDQTLELRFWRFRENLFSVVKASKAKPLAVGVGRTVAWHHSIDPLTSNLFIVFFVWNGFSHLDGLVNGLRDFFVIGVGQVY